MSRKFDFVNGSTRAACEQGSTFQAGVYVRGPYKEVIDLTGYTGKMQVRATPSGSALLTISTSNGYMSINTTTGKVSWTVPAAVTSAVAAGNYYYDLELTSAGGVVKRIIEGKFDVTAEVTQ